MTVTLRSTSSVPQHKLTPQEALRSIRAERELLAIEESVQALAAEHAGMTQRQIAASLGRSQTDVHRLLRKARAGLPSAARRLILEAAAGRISRGTMVGRLKPEIARRTDPTGEQVDGYEPGELDEAHSPGNDIARGDFIRARSTPEDRIAVRKTAEALDQVVMFLRETELIVVA